MKKPTPVREIGILTIHQSVRMIAGNGTGDAISELNEFGKLYYDDGEYHLFVSSVYDFDAVVKWIENYGKGE